jgi:hypothetical protein
VILGKFWSGFDLQQRLKPHRLKPQRLKPEVFE